MMLELSLALSCYPHKHLWKGHWSYINSWWGHRSTWSVCFWEIQHSQTSIDKTFLFRINSVSHTTGIESSTYTHQEKWMHNREKKIWRNTTFGLGASSAPLWITLYNSPLGRDTTSDSAALAYERVHHWVSTTSKRGSTPTVRAVQITQRSWLMMLLFSMHLGCNKKTSYSQEVLSSSVLSHGTREGRSQKHHRQYDRMREHDWKSCREWIVLNGGILHSRHANRKLLDAN